MEVSSELYTSVALHSGKNPDARRIGGCASPTAGVDAVSKR